MKERRREGEKERRRELSLHSFTPSPLHPSSHYSLHPFTASQLHPLSPNKIFLVQTDTTVGFLSQNAEKLARIKKRVPSKPFLISVDSFKTLKSFARSPKKYKKLVRRAKKTTFVYPNNKAIRVVKEDIHEGFLKRFKWMFSTSANEAGKKFDKNFAFKVCDVVVEDERGFFEGKPSKIIKLGKKKKKFIR